MRVSSVVVAGYLPLHGHLQRPFCSSCLASEEDYGRHASNVTPGEGNPPGVADYVRLREGLARLAFDRPSNFIVNLFDLPVGEAL